MCVGLFFLSACTTQIAEYRQSKPDFVLEDYFNGKLVAFGMVQDYSKKMTRHFCVNINANWIEKQGNLEGIIDEIFYFNDGEVDTRIWRITRKEDQQGSYYIGTADDVVGEASGRSEGSVFQWQYDLQIPITNKNNDKKLYTFFIDDWIYLIDKDRAFNKSTIEKLGVTVGHITLFFDRQQPLRECNKSTDTAQDVIETSLITDRLNHLVNDTFHL